MKIIYITLCLLTFSFISFAQQNATVSQIVLLTDGSILKGTIIEQNNDNILKIVLKSGDKIELPYALVQSISENKNQEIIFANGTKSSTKGFYQVMEFGVLPGYSDEEKTQLLWGLTGRYTMGYRFHPLFAIGAGVGADYYNQMMLPIYMDIRGYLFKKTVSPYYSLNIGYGSPLQFRQNSITTKGGLMFRPTIGLRIARAKHVFNINTGYQIQKVRASRFNWDGGRTIDNLTYRRWSIGLGWEF